MRIGAQLYTVRELLRDPSRLPTVLRRLRAIGYEGVEVAGIDAIGLENFESELNASGLIACAAHVGLERIAPDPSDVGRECRRLGCDYVVIPSLPESYHSAGGFARFAHESAAIAVALKSFDLELVYHNHAFEFERWDGWTGMQTLFETASPEALKAELDTYWIEYAGDSAATWIRRLAGRVPLVHLKDMSRVDGKPVQVEVGEGSLDWIDILSACREAGTTWLVVEQDECAGDPLDSLEISYRNLNRLLAAT